MARPPIAPGRMRGTVAFLRRQAGQDEAGQPVDTWVPHVSVFADVRAGSGLAAAQRLAADANTSAAAYSARIRFRTDITIEMRAQFGGQLFDVRAVLPDLAGRRHTDVVMVAGGVS